MNTFPQRPRKYLPSDADLSPTGWRWRTLVILVLFAWVALVARLLWVQGINHAVYGKKAEGQYKGLLEVTGTRGTIYDYRGRALAVDLPHFYAVGVVPSKLLKNKKSLSKLASVLGIRPSRLNERLKSKSPFVWIDRGVEESRANQVKNLALPGVRVAREPKRTYPYGSIAGQLLGATDCDRIGITGLEHHFDAQLRDERRLVPYWTDGRRTVKVAEDDRTLLPRGQDLYLTIDLIAQTIVEEELANAVETHHADCGIAVMTDPQTGRIIALATYPSFDPNQPENASADKQRCRAVTDMYEPGSTFKLVTAAAALESGKVAPEQTFFCENGRAIIGNRTFRDAHPHGTLTFREIFSLSSNIGMAKIGQVLGSNLLYKTARDFGFGEFTGINLDGEAKGVLRPPSKWSGSSLSNFCIGQGVSVTTIQLAMAYGAVTNGGYLLKPQLVRSGLTNNPCDPIRIRRVFSPHTADVLKDFMVEAVRTGTGKPAAIDSLAVAGKTGTAQKVDTTRNTYFQNRFLSSFVGFAPANDPKYLVLLILDDPKGFYYGSQVAAPAFKRIMQRWMASEASTNPMLTMSDSTDTKTKIADDLSKNNLVAQNVSTAYEDSTNVMPKLIGVPIRKAVRALTLRGLEVSTTGTGSVKSQFPQPGTALKPDTRCQLIGETTS